MKHALTMRSVCSSVGNFTLGPIDLELDLGKVVGLVGPNGSGKTTTMKTIMGILHHGRGTIEVYGQAAEPSAGKWKESIGYVPDKPIFYDWMSGADFIRLVSRFYPKWDPHLANDLASRFRLDLDTTIKRLSMGNRVKLSLVMALAHRPQLALFDEPTSGLDPVVRAEVFEVLTEMLETDSMTVFYSTHILDDLDRMADELVFLRNGNVQLHENKDVLVDRWRRIRVRHDGDLPPVPGLVTHSRQETVHEVVSSSGSETLEALKSLGMKSVVQTPLALEEIAVHIMKGGHHDRHDRHPAPHCS